MDNNNTNEVKAQKEVFTEPTCELVSFSFEDILADEGGSPITGPEDEFGLI